MQPLTIDALCTQAHTFATQLNQRAIPELFGTTDGKAVGTYLERSFKAYLHEQYDFAHGNAASGIDFPGIGVDIKTTSSRQPQSSCPFSSARQKVYGLGYGLLIFVYDKQDDAAARSATLHITNTIFVQAQHTADFQTTRGLRQILDNEGNADDLVAFLQEKHLSLDDIGLRALAEEIMRQPPEQGWLTISNVLQWRLQYSRAIEKAGSTQGLRLIYKSA